MTDNQNPTTTTKRKVATLVTSGTSGSGADWRLYRVDPPMHYEGGVTDHVRVSAVEVDPGYHPITDFVGDFGSETYIFPASAENDVIDWGELPGSYRGGLDHEQALRNAGYEVVS